MSSNGLGQNGPKSHTARLDKRAIVIGVVLAAVLALVIWFLHARAARPTGPPAQPLIPQTKK